MNIYDSDVMSSASALQRCYKMTTRSLLQALASPIAGWATTQSGQ